MPPNQKETKTVILSDEPQAEACAILANPDGESYETAWERMMQDFERKNKETIENPPLDALGRRRKDYIPAMDDIACDERHPEPWEDQGDGKDAFGNPTSENDNLPMLLNSVKGSRMDNEHRVVLFRDHMLEFPELNLKIFLVGPSEDCRGFPQLLARAGCVQAESVDDADVVLFTGGPDVDPSYYGTKALPCTCTNEDRDNSDLQVYWTCYNDGIPMVGVCRGAQFGAVMGGFKLVQDLDGHNGDHAIWDKNLNRSIDRVSSVHHQAVIPGIGMEVLAYATMSTRKWLDPTTVLEKNKLKIKYPNDCEAFFIRETCFFGVQGHPEYRGYNAYAKWFLNYINELIILNPDVDFVTNEAGELRRRLKPEFVKERENRYREQYQEVISKASKKKDKKTLSIPSNIIPAEGE